MEWNRTFTHDATALNEQWFPFHPYQQGEDAQRKCWTPPCADDLATIMYTSGSTGDPKVLLANTPLHFHNCLPNLLLLLFLQGVMLSHGNMMATIAGCMTNGPNSTGRENVCLSYLPLAHIFERVAEFGVLLSGGSIGYFSGVCSIFSSFFERNMWRLRAFFF